MTKPTHNPNGRPKKTIDKELLISLYSEFKDWDAVAAHLEVSRSTIYRRLNEHGLVKTYNYFKQF